MCVCVCVSYLIVVLDVSDDDVEVLYPEVDVVVDIFVHTLVSWIGVSKNKQK